MHYVLKAINIFAYAKPSRNDITNVTNRIQVWGVEIRFWWSRWKA